MKKIFIAAVCCMAMLAGCQQAEEIVNSSEELVMSIEASIGESNVVAGRYVGTTPNEVSFADGDAIGLSVNGEGFDKWTYNDASWSQQSEKPKNWNDKKNDHSFYAFYPYVKDASMPSVSMPLLSKQNGDMNSVASRDFLVASKTQKYGLDGKVSFTDEYAFSHVSSLVSITLKGNADLATATITKISISGTDLFTSSTCTFDTESKDVKVTLDMDESKKVDLLEVAMEHNMNSSDKTFYFVVNSATVDLSEVKLSIEYKFSENDKYKAERTGLKKESDTVGKFESGKQYSYTLNIQDRALIISGSNIKNWEAGESLGEITINGTKQ